MKRHVSVAGHKGIYYSELNGGKRSYEVRYVDSDGRLRFEVVGPKLQQALDRAAEIRVKKTKGERVAPNRMLFQECVEEWRLHRKGRKGEELAPRTIQTYESLLKNHVLPKLGKKQVQKITADDIALLLRQLDLAPNTRKFVYSVLSDVLSFAANPRRGYIPFNPCSMLEDGERPAKQRMEPRLYTDVEAQALLAASPDWMRPLIQTSLLTGMRLQEVLGLRWQDVDFKQDVISVRGQLSRDRLFVPTKGRKSRDVPLLPALRKVLLGQPTRFSQGYVFVNQQGNPHGHTVIEKTFSNARARANLSPVPRPLRFHDLRHTFASVLLQDGKDVAWVSRILGHSSVQTTMDAYWHVVSREDRSEQAAERLGEALGSWAK